MDLLGDANDFYYKMSPLVVGIQQPLFQLNEHRLQQKSNDLNFDLKQRQLLEQILQNDRNIIADYFNAIVTGMEVDIAQVNRTVNDSIFILSQKRFDVGKIAENDLLESELALMNAELALTTAEAGLDAALTTLRLHLGLDASGELTLSPPPAFPTLSVHENDAILYARRYGSAQLEAELNRLQYDANLKRAKATRRLDATLTARAGFDKTGQDLGDFTSHLLDRQSVTVSFDVPLFNWGEKSARVREAQAALRQQEIERQLSDEELDQSVSELARNVKLLQHQLDIAARADTIGQRRFEVARNRYLIGKVDITALLLAQEAQNSARKSYITTLRALWLAYYDLKSETLWDFESNQPLTLDD